MEETLEEQCACTDECLGYLTQTCKKIEESNKQETLEEAGEKLYPNRESFLYRFQNIERLAFTAGAKWQKERSYTENQMDDAYDKGFKDAFERMYTEQEVLHLLDTLWDRLDLWYNKGMECDETEFNLRKWFDECELKKK